MYVADAGADLAEFNESSSDEQLSVLRHSSVLIPCAVPLSIPSPPLISYLRDDRPLKLTGTLTRSLAWCVPVTVFSALHGCCCCCCCCHLSCSRALHAD